MTLKSQIGSDLNSLSPEGLAEAFQYISKLKKNSADDKLFAWKKYIGILSDAEAKRLMKTVKKEFEKIEGEW
jgi:hypothetical protein